MAVEWFYTANKHQMGPVSWDELKQLAESGLLKPNDMVWCEGMDEWVKAVKQKGLFSDDDGEPSPRKARKRDEEGVKPPPGKRARTREDDDEEEDEDDRAKARREKAKRESSKVAMKVGLIIGGVILLLFVLICGGVMFFWWGGASTPEPGRPYTWTYDKNIRVGNSVQTNINFKNGQRYAISVSANANNGATNLDFFITRSNGQNVVMANGRGLNYQMNLTFNADDAYRVRVENRGPGIVANYRVVFTPQ
jgi:hypothetical protein